MLNTENTFIAVFHWESCDTETPVYIKADSEHDAFKILERAAIKSCKQDGLHLEEDDMSPEEYVKNYFWLDVITPICNLATLESDNVLA